MTTMPVLRETPQAKEAPVEVTLSLAANVMRAFPGETVQLTVWLTSDALVPALDIMLHVPALCKVDAAPLADGAALLFELDDGTQQVVWRVAQLVAHQAMTFDLRITLPRDGWDWHEAENHRLLHFGCSASAPAMHEPATDALTLAVQRRADLTKYLPGIYQGGGLGNGNLASHEFMWRFLMLIERLSEPTVDRIEGIEWYFDRTVTPPHMLPWLAWCLAFKLDEAWDECRQRRALGMMARLYRQRGTKAGMKSLLALYFDERPAIIEPSCFMLANDTRLGLNTTLGDKRRPYSFTVRFQRSLSAREQDLARALVAANKPAHTDFELITADSPMEKH